MEGLTSQVGGVTREQRPDMLLAAGGSGRSFISQNTPWDERESVRVGFGRVWGERTERERRVGCENEEGGKGWSEGRYERVGRIGECREDRRV